jgi:hypothetical protein
LDGEQYSNEQRNQSQLDLEAAASSVLKAFQLWFLGSSEFAKWAERNTSQAIQSMTEDFQALRKSNYRKARVDLAKREILDVITMVSTNDLDHDELLILSLLARHFRSRNGIPSRRLVQFAARPFGRLDCIISKVHRRYIANSEPASLEEFRRSFKRVMSIVEYHTIIGTRLLA